MHKITYILWDFERLLERRYDVTPACGTTCVYSSSPGEITGVWDKGQPLRGYPSFFSTFPTALNCPFRSSDRRQCLRAGNWMRPCFWASVPSVAPVLWPCLDQCLFHWLNTLCKLQLVAGPHWPSLAICDALPLFLNLLLLPFLFWSPSWTIHLVVLTSFRCAIT